MSLFKIEIIAVNPKKEEMVSDPVTALLDTGSELTWLPEEVLTKTGIIPRRERQFVTADGKRLTRKIGYAILVSDRKIQFY